jgi:hypothetical protein
MTNICPRRRLVLTTPRLSARPMSNLQKGSTPRASERQQETSAWALSTQAYDV